MSGFRSASPTLGASAAPAGVSAGYASLLGPLGGSAPAATGAQVGYRSLLGPLGGSVGTGGAVVTPDTVRDSIESLFAVHFDGMRLTAAQRRKLFELKEGIWHQAGRKHMTKTHLRWLVANEARRFKERTQWFDERGRERKVA